MKKYIYATLAIIAMIGIGCDTHKEEPLITFDDEIRAANNMVIYECNERLFAEENAFRAIEDYVPTLKKMGVDVLWLMPIHPRGEGDKSIGSPYCVKDYTAIDPKFGNMDDLKRLVQTCHDHEMRVILDWIANHTAWDNVWVAENEAAWYEGPSSEDEKNWVDVHFLNFQNQDVCDTMKACMLYWIREADIDGYRCDYASGVPMTFWKDVNAAILSLKPNALLLAETSDTQHYSAGFELLYSWSYLNAIEDLFKGTGSFSSLISAHNSEYKSTPKSKERMRYVTTHDETATKAPQSIYRNAERELAAFCLTSFMGGVPMIYSSQELGHMSSINFFEYNILDFTSPNATRNALANIMRVYKETRNLRGGKQVLSTLSSKVPYVEYTLEDGSALLVVCNTSDKEQEVKLPMRYEGIEVTNMLTNQQEHLKAITTLKAGEYRIYKK